MKRALASWSAVLPPVTLAAAVTIAVTLLYQKTVWMAEQPGSVTLSFLLFLPFATAAVASFAGDPRGLRDQSYYLAVPIFILAGAVLAGVVLFREGVICVLMLSPLWWLAGTAGSMTTYLLRRRIRERGRLFCSALFALPLAMSAVESRIPQQVSGYEVVRSIQIDAPARVVWPKLVNIPDVRADEGEWNITQDVFGIPRPAGATLRYLDGHLVREAKWYRGISFKERLTAITPGKLIRWAFRFPDASVQRATDRHISPDGAHLKIVAGEYQLTELPGGRSQVTLRTSYVLRSPLNEYASWWGDLFLGDVEANVLAIVKERSERT